MVTLEQITATVPWGEGGAFWADGTEARLPAIGEYHYGECTRTVGPRGGVRNSVERWRVNGAVKTWKTRPGEFRLPLKYGMGYAGQHAYLTDRNAAEFHAAADCPLNAADLDS